MVGNRPILRSFKIYFCVINILAMKKHLFMITLLGCNCLIFSQVGISTPNPQATLHVDGSKNNPATGIPTTLQQADDVVVTSQGNVGIGTIAPDASSALDISSANKGFLPPRVTLSSATDAATISSPATGLTTYHTGNIALEAGLYTNIGTPLSPIWNKGKSLAENEGAHFYKLIYRGTTVVTPAKTLVAGLFEWKIGIRSTFQTLQARLRTPPSATVTMQGPRFAWTSTFTSTFGSSVSWSASDYDQWKEIDFQSSAASHLLYLDVSSADDFYRVSFYTRRDSFTSLLVEVY